MTTEPPHRWDLSPTEAVALQREMAGRVDVSRPLGDFDLIAGADISYNRFSTTVYAGVVVLRRSESAPLEVVERQGFVGEMTFPYIPGLLSFREAPVLLEAFAKLKTKPDVAMLDGQGIAHPRRLGLASHIGLWLGLPCVGCAKSKLTGTFRNLGPRRGDTVPLMDKDEVIGRVVRTKTNVKPVYVSPGHLIDLDSAVRVVLATGRGYRIPEPTRQAHNYVNALRRGEPT